MADRGFYRSIYTVLYDSPDFQKLSARAKHILLTLKTNRFNNIAGIFIFDNGSFVTLIDHTGYNAAELEEGLQELCDRLWIAYQYPILWIINSLEYEPNINLSNEKHRIGVMTILKSLPKQEIIANYCAHYSLTIPSGYPIERLSIPSQYPIRYRREENKERYNINNSGEQLKLAEQIDNSSATPPSDKNTEIEKPKEPPAIKTSKPKTKIDEVSDALNANWAGAKINRITPGGINKLLNEGFGTYDALICAIETNKPPKDDAYAYLLSIARQPESADKYAKMAEKRLIPTQNGINYGTLLKDVNAKTTSG